jgi:hypothetical protein
LDQIRVFTVNLTRAAGALGVPMNQLNEEVRDLLAGNISARNTRIATALGITNEMIRDQKQRNTLADFLNQKFAVFEATGERTAKTFRGVTSNTKQALDTLGATVTKPLFDKLAAAGFTALNKVFDVDTAKLSPAFSGITELAQRMFGGLGDLLARAIDGRGEWRGAPVEVHPGQPRRHRGVRPRRRRRGDGAHWCGTPPAASCSIW